MFKNKILILITALTLIFSLAACGGSQTPTEDLVPQISMRVVDGVIQYQVEGQDGWKNLLTLEDITGQDGVGVQSATINALGELVITYTNGTSQNLGVVQGEDALTPLSVVSFEVNAAGELVVTYSDDSTQNLGLVRQPEVTPRQVDSFTVNAQGELIVVFNDNTSENLGLIRGPQGTPGAIGNDGADGVIGMDGLSAFEIYKSFNPNYTKTEAAWLDDLLDRRLSDSSTLDVMTAADLAAVSATTAAAVKLQSNITGSVVLSSPLNIDFNGYTILGNLTINGSNTMSVELTDTYNDESKITGDLIINAPNLTLSNSIDIDGKLVIEQISMASYNGVSNISGGVILEGPGRLNLQGDASSANVTINTTSSVILAGTIAKVIADITGSSITIEDETSVTEVIIEKPGRLAFQGDSGAQSILVNAPTNVIIESDDTATLPSLTGAGSSAVTSVAFVVVTIQTKPATIDVDVLIEQIKDNNGNSITPVAVSPIDSDGEKYRILKDVDYSYVLTLKGNDLVTNGGIVSAATSGVEELVLNPIKVQDVLSMSSGLPVYFEAVVSGYRAFSGAKGIFVQDLNTAHAIFVFEDFANDGPGVDLGNTVTLYGETGVFTSFGNNLKQIVNAKLVDNQEDEQPIFVVSDVSFEDALSDYPTNAGIRFEFSNLTISSIAFNNFFFDSGVTTLPALRVDYRNYAMHLRDVYDVGDVIESITVNFYDLFNGDIRGEAVDVPLTVAQLKAIALEELSIPPLVLDSVTLAAVLTVSGMFYDIATPSVFTVTYTSESDRLNPTTGVITNLPRGTTPTSITVTAVVVLGDFNISQEIVIELSPRDPMTVSEVWAEAVSSSSFSVVLTGIVAGFNDRGYILQDPETYQFIAIHDGVNKPSLGDEVTIAGSFGVSFNIARVISITSYTVESSDNAVVYDVENAVEIDFLDFDVSDYQGELVLIKRPWTRFTGTSNTSYARLAHIENNLGSQAYGGKYIGLQIGANELNLDDKLIDLLSNGTANNNLLFPDMWLYVIFYDSTSAYNKAVLISEEYIVTGNAIPTASLQLTTAQTGAALSQSTTAAVSYGSQITITASAVAGMAFEGWFDTEGNQVSGEAATQIRIYENITLTAVYVTLPLTPIIEDFAGISNFSYTSQGTFNGATEITWIFEDAQKGSDSSGDFIQLRNTQPSVMKTSFAGGIDTLVITAQAFGTGRSFDIIINEGKEDERILQVSGLGTTLTQFEFSDLDFQDEFTIKMTNMSHALKIYEIRLTPKP